VRVANESGATELPVERADEDDLARLEECADRMAERPPWEEYRRADVRFHIGVAEAAHSPRILTAMTEIQGEMTELVSRISHPDEVLMRSNDQHRKLVELIRRRDTGRAVKLMREHIEGTEHILIGLLRG
jgi:DNA-binding GntR family transcriptional regulator